jgi:hypothetical protein
LFLVAILVPFSGLQGFKLPSLNLPCSHAGLVMKAFAVMLQWSQSKGTLHVHGRPSWQCWLSTRGREDDQANALETTCGSMEGFAQHLEFMANVGMGECSAKRILELEPENAAGYVLLTNISAAVGNGHLCGNVEQQRKAISVKK